jgi:DHA2 family multidrug resistance protein
MQASGLPAEQSRAVLERLIDAQAATIAVNHVFTVAAIVLILAAFLVWLVPKPPVGSFMMGGGH